MVNAIYLDESGTAQQMATQATITLKPLLDTIAVDADMSATDLFVQLGQAGEQLGEATRARIEASSSDAAAIVTPAELRRRMRAWVEIADTILRALNISKAPPAAIEAIRQPLIEAATKATARRRARRKKPQEPASEGEAGERARSRRERSNHLRAVASPPGAAWPRALWDGDGAQFPWQRAGGKAGGRDILAVFRAS